MIRPDSDLHQSDWAKKVDTYKHHVLHLLFGIIGVYKLINVLSSKKKLTAPAWVH